MEYPIFYKHLIIRFLYSTARRLTYAPRAPCWACCCGRTASPFNYFPVLFGEFVFILYFCISVDSSQAVNSAGINEHKEHFPREGQMLFYYSNGWARFQSSLSFPTINTNMLINIGKVTIQIFAQGAEDRPVHVQAHYRVRNGRREFVRAHWRRLIISRSDKRF